MDDALMPWLIQTVQFYRPLDFFRDYDDLSDRELAQTLAGQYQRAWDAAVDPSSELAELELLSLDDSRVWWEDTDAGWMHGDGTWEWVLDGWSRISRGAFRPMHIEERWREDGVTLIRFQESGREIELKPQRSGGALDMNVLYDINAHLKSTGMRFEMVAPFDETACLMALRSDEKARMEARGWQFQ